MRKSKSHEVDPKGKKTLEILNHSTIVNMKEPVVTYEKRRLGYKFMAAEAYWILTGRNDVDFIGEYSKQISQFSDDGYFFNGAYGPRIVDQLTYVVNELMRDIHTRQAVMTIWRPNPRPSVDIPCTISVQFMVRNDKLHIFDTMRSSDIWLGWPYDVFNFTALAVYVALLYKMKTKRVLDLGNLYLTAASQHLYESDMDAALEVVSDATKWTPLHFNVHQFENPNQLLQWLHILAKKNGVIDTYVPDKQTNQ
jgi:thymidylate synthase